MTRDPSLHILQHALGLDDYGHGNAYRNHYVATEGSDDYKLCTAHVAAGLMKIHGTGTLYGGMNSFCFTVTSAGRQFVLDHSPKPPKLTRSQRRYRKFLVDDSGLTFGEWLRSDWARA